MTLLALLACTPDRSDPGFAAKHLPAILPILTELEARGVTLVRVQDWCRALAYDRGTFVATREPPENCTMDPSLVPRSAPFDDAALADANGWSSRLAAAGFPVFWVQLGYDPAGKAASVELAADSFSRLSYQWNPARPPVTTGSDVVASPVPGFPGWFVVVEDWN